MRSDRTTTGKGEIKIDGYPKTLRWTVSQRRNLDSDQVRAGLRPEWCAATPDP